MSLLKGKLFKRKIPIFVSYAVTQRCNLNCDYCVYKGLKWPDSELNTEDALNLISQLASAGNVFLMLTGGEPLLRNDIDLLVEHAYSKGLTVAMSTNGTLLPGHTDILKRLSYISISVDGPSDAHDKVRGKGSFEKAVNAICLARANGVKVITTTTIGTHNIKNIDFMFDFAAENNVIPRFQIETTYTELGNEFLSSGKRIKNNERIRPGHKEIENVIKYIKQKGVSHGYQLISKPAMDYILKWPDYSKVVIMEPHPSFSRIKCYAGLYHFYVTWDGRLFPCCSFIYKSKGQKILEKGIFQALSDSKDVICGGCMSLPVIELNLLMGFNFKSLYNAVKSFIRK